MSINSSFIEIFPGEEVCTAECDHCPYKSNTSGSGNKTLTEMQGVFFEKVQYLLSKKNIQNQLSISESIYESQLESLPFYGAFNLNKIIINLGDIKENYILKEEFLIKHAEKILSEYQGKKPELSIAQHFNTNFFEQSQKNQSEIQKMANLIISTSDILKGGDTIFTPNMLNFLMASNNININDYNLESPYQNVHHYQKLLELISQGLMDKKQNQFNSQRLVSSNKSLLIENTFQLGGRGLYINYRATHNKHINKKKRKSLKEGKTMRLALYPKKVLIDHSTYNINIEDFWFTYKEINKILDTSLSIEQFYAKIISALDQRGIDVQYLEKSHFYRLKESIIATYLKARQVL